MGAVVLGYSAAISIFRYVASVRLAVTPFPNPSHQQTGRGTSYRASGFPIDLSLKHTTFIVFQRYA